jgi:large subunit ribosomal protein L25
MEQKTLDAMSRDQLKKGAAKRLRREGKIPAVVYGHSGTAAITIDAREFSQKFKRISENTIIDLHVGEDNYDVLVKDYQEDILSNRILHIDFYEIERGKTLRTNVPVHTVGSAIGVREGGVLDTMLHTIEVECFPKDIPEYIEMDISGLDIGESIHVGDIEPPENVTFLVPEDYTIVSIIAPRSLEELEALEAEAEEELEEGEAAEMEGEEVAEGEESDEAAEEEE